MWPHRIDRAVRFLKSLGVDVRQMPHAGQQTGWVAGSAHERVADIHTAFADDSIKAILCSMGGNHCNQLLPYLDYELIREHPKIFQGYSDITVLHWSIFKHS